MRKFRNTIMIILALLPILSIILSIAFALGGNFTEPDLLIPDIITSPCGIIKEANGTYTVVPFDQFTLVDNALLRASGSVGGLSTPEYPNGFFLNQKLVLGTLHLMQESDVCVITTPMVFMGYYFVYIFVLVMLELVFNLVTFVPRKCSEFLIGGSSI